MRRIALRIGLVATSAVWLGCGSADQSPLGGPFGGTANVTPAAGAEAGAGSSSGSSSGSGSSGGSSGGGSGSGGSSGGGTSGCTSSAVPTFSQLYTNYFALGTVGNCAQTSCHTQMPSASATYTWLQGQTELCGSPNCLASLASPTGSCLSWFGGSMPQSGPTSNAQATCDIDAWAAAGSKNN